MADQPPSRRRFQFRLRSLLIGVTVFCVVVGGFVGWQAKIVRERLALRDSCATVAIFLDEEDVLFTHPPREKSTVSWIRERLGDKAVHAITCYKGIAPETANRIVAAFPEADITLPPFLQR
jgi:hypothetical protein